jgi:hypothetical protein
MAFTNAELVRQEAGDSGFPIRDAASGDGIQTTFFLSSYPIISNSQSVTIGGVAQSETVNYTINDETGELVFTSAPALGTDNIVITYFGVQIRDAAIVEACRQFGLVSSATADAGPSAAVINAAAMVCNWKASEYANEFDFDTDGQSFKRGALAKQWSDRAEALRARAAKRTGLVSVPVTKIDGYSSEYTARDTSGSDTNVRRQYYGEEDRIP